jgi:hypothetical protein
MVEQDTSKFLHPLPYLPPRSNKRMTEFSKPPMAPQQAQAYKDATDNLMFLKHEQVEITYYTWLLLAALYLLSKGVNPNDKLILLAGVIAVLILSVVFVWSLRIRAAGRSQESSHVSPAR